MPIQYKIDVIAALKEAGYNTTRIRKEKIMGEAMLQKILLYRHYLTGWEWDLDLQ